MKKVKESIYKDKPWGSMDEYFKLVKQYNLAGADLEKAVKQDRAKKAIPMPKVVPTTST